MDSATPAIQPRSWAKEAALEADLPRPAGSSPEQTATAILGALEHAVVGQRSALREISLLLAMHALGERRFRAPNALVIGPTGVGKTHTLSAASRALGLPFVATDATSLVPSGIVGEQVEDVLDQLVRSADSILSSARVPRRPDDALSLAGRGVILLDEFDKLAAPDDGSSVSRQAERQVIQRRLLKLAEGARLRVGIKQHDEAFRDRFIDTDGILLLMSGAFTGLSQRRSWRRMGPPGPADGQRTRFTPTDIVEAGFLPELIGRLPVLIVFDPLTPADLVGIIDNEDVSPMATWRHYFEAAFGVRLVLDDTAKWVVAERAAGLGIGARGLQHVLFPILSAKAAALFACEEREEVVLRASDVLPEAIAMPLASGVQ